MSYAIETGTRLRYTTGARMSEWIEFPKNKPQSDIVALVFNEKGFMRGLKAIYHSRCDTWVLYDPKSLDSFTLEVTHYFPIPEYPPLRDDL